MEIINSIGQFLSDYVLVVILIMAALWYSWRTRFVQLRMPREMLRLLIHSTKRSNDSRSLETEGNRTISSFQAFMISIASRVGTGNLAGVATAISIGGPGAVFWMWVMALLGAATSFVETTLAQLFKSQGEKSFVGGPAYYINKGIESRAWAVTFAVLITLTFGLAFNSVQSNTISEAFENVFGLDRVVSGIGLALLTIIVISGGIQSIAKFNQVIVPVMAIGYIALTVYIIGVNFSALPGVFKMIVSNAFGFDEALGGAMGTAVVMGFKRGLFSNEAGEGSTPNAAATASVSHPVKQGLIQSLGVLIDTLVICSCTAMIILCSGVNISESNGIVLTQNAIDAGIGGERPVGSIYVSIAIFFFAFSSIVANYYYGETNLRFIHNSRMLIRVYRLAVTALVYIGSVATLGFVWSFADITMALMTLCNLAALTLLGKYAIICLKDYTAQRRVGKDPIYHSSTIPSIADKTECWD